MKENLKTIVIALLIALGVRTVAFEPFKIPSESMLPNLLVGDFLFVSKYSYGYSKYSIIFAPIPFKGRIMAREPERGDIAVFRNPRTDENFIKRVAGLPGDSIGVVNGRVVINGQVVSRERIEYAPRQDGRSVQGIDIESRAAYFRETFPPSEKNPDGHSHVIREVRDNDSAGPFNVPAGHYFMMGDNRDDSTDSRRTLSVGFVPHENFIGRAEIIFFSMYMDGKSWLQFWRWPTAIRWDRFFDRIN